MFLQQWANAAMWDGVGWVNRIMERVGTCLFRHGKHLVIRT